LRFHILVAIFGLLAISVPASLPEGLGCSLRGYRDYNLQFFIEFHGFEPEDEKIELLAFLVYSKPSHTLLLAIVDERLPVKWYREIQRERPRSLTLGSVADQACRIEMEPPPDLDASLSVRVLYRDGGEVFTVAFAEGTFETLEEFHFAARAAGGGDVLVEALCAEGRCVQIRCKGNRFALSCPDCRLTCQTPPR